MNSLDLNLLRVLDLLLRTHSVTETSYDIGLSVPATSRALGRLRVALEDPLFTRAGRTLTPTPYAESIAPRVRTLIEQADSLPSKSQLNDPREWEQTVTIRANEGMVPVIGSVLAPAVAREAPGLQIRFAPEGNEGAEPLRTGAVDLDLGSGLSHPADIRTEAVTTSPFVALTGGLALACGRTMALDEFCRTPHLSASRRGQPYGPIDTALKAMGRSRRVVAVYPSITSAIFMVGPGLILPVPLLLAEKIVAAHPVLKWHYMPVETPHIDIGIAWHRRVDEDPAITWVRNQLVAGLKAQSSHVMPGGAMQKESIT